LSYEGEKIMIEKMDSFEYVKLGKIRIIGFDGYNTGDDYFKLKERIVELMPKLNALPLEERTVFKNLVLMTHHNGKEWDSGEVHQMLGYFFSPDIPVPEGYDYYDVPTEWGGYGVYSDNDFNGDYFTPAYEWTRDKILQDEVGIPYPEAYWICEVYIEGMWQPGQKGAHQFGYLFSSKNPSELCAK
jgi:hypothetical protein